MKSVILSDGRELCYREAGAGPVLLMLHGWSMSSAVFQEVMALLSDDFRVLAPDLPGHGASTVSRLDFSQESFAADLEEWLALIGIDTLHLLGWSLGGQVAIQMAARRKVRIERLILVATTPYFVAASDWPHGLPVTQVRAMDRQMQRHYEQSMSEFFRLMFDGEELAQERYRDIIRFAVRDGSLPEREVSRRGLKILGSTDLRPLLEEIDMPTLVHYGELDLITVPAACRSLAETIPGAREVRLDDVGHAPFLSRPDKAAALWREFLP